VPGSGRRLFPENVGLPLRLTDIEATSAGVIIATYEPER
jgi:hypothetical protein